MTDYYLLLLLLAHYDGTYETPDGKERSFYTLHLYLNDSAQAPEQQNGESAPNSGSAPLEAATKGGDELLRGGATAFHSLNMERRLDVDPKAGRVLIFQHRRLCHSGAEVEAGVKYTMRTDVMHKFDGYEFNGNGRELGA
jgi:hypothetical protein